MLIVTTKIMTCESVKMISQIVLDLHGVIVDLKRVGLFGYEQKRLS